MNPSFQELVSNFPAQGIHTIKLKHLLNLRSPSQLMREIRTAFPPVTIGSVTLVDQIVLLCLDELLAPDKILEIGTFQGFTTRLLASNSSAKLIHSVDLPPTHSVLTEGRDDQKILCDGDYNDDYLRDLQNQSGEIYLKDLTPDERSRIRLVKGDSTQLDFPMEFVSIDYAFIDGGHRYETVKSDTENVLRVMPHGVIIWHDFGSSIHSEVTRYLTDRSNANQIFHIQGSLCAFQLIGF